MRCFKCQHDNREEARYCEECGAKLQLICPECDSELKLQAKYCHNCGIDLQKIDWSAISKAEPEQVPAIDGDDELNDDESSKDKEFLRILEKLARGEISAETADKMLQMQGSIRKPSKISSTTNPNDLGKIEEPVEKPKSEKEAEQKPYAIHSVVRSAKMGSSGVAVERLKLVTNSWRRAQNSD